MDSSSQDVSLIASRASIKMQHAHTILKFLTNILIRMTVCRDTTPFKTLTPRYARLIVGTQEVLSIIMQEIIRINSGHCYSYLHNNVWHQFLHAGLVSLEWWKLCQLWPTLPIMRNVRFMPFLYQWLLFGCWLFTLWTKVDHSPSNSESICSSRNLHRNTKPSRWDCKQPLLWY